MLALSNAGRSTFLGTKRKSEGWTVVEAVVAAAWERRTASKEAATAVSVVALTVASTNALIAAGSMAADAVVAEGKKAPSGAVGEGVGVLVALLRIRACGEGYLKVLGSCRVDLVDGRRVSGASDVAVSSGSAGEGTLASSGVCGGGAVVYGHQDDMERSEGRTNQMGVVSE